ncbi:MAG: phosphoribosylanthranilate isomerase [Methanocorpusculum sp.]|nr:phosphoribosylanthranilate isomerase [Methanocorpusculum sp.]MDD3046915.1 phosphoribosylanthranilate isomerase [Methanocorpusculum sp.]MDD3912164.1 phosphoribosylanthranilate isomerase [Methanocorpusculum sp.]
MRVKICGITTVRDALIAEEEGADAIGIVVCSDSKRSVPVSRARAIFAALHPNTEKICVTNTQSQSDLELILSLKPTAIQIPQNLKVPAGVGTKVYRVASGETGIPEKCDAVVIDQSCGRGIVYDRSYAEKVVEKSAVPVILAGGLTPDNVGDAIRDLRLYAVDVSSGVEKSKGIKDRKKMREFIEICRRPAV